MREGLEYQAIAKELVSLFPPEFLEKEAKESRFIQRSRELDPTVFFWSLVLDFGVGLESSLTRLHRNYQEAAASEICWSAYYEHFNERLAEFLRRCLLHALESTANDSVLEVDERLARCAIRDIIVVDSTLIPLNEKLTKEFPNARSKNCPAAAKLQVETSSLGGAPHDITVTAGKSSDQTLFTVDDWIRNKLVLFDLGYYKAERFQEIAAKGGYFVSRLKDNIDPYIVERSGTPPCGRAIDISGKRLRDIEPGLCRKSFDARALLIPKTLSKTEREALGRGDHTALNPVRLVGCLNEETGKYHFYATNLPVSSFDPEQVASCYRTRWVIELLFKELKSKYKLDRISSCKQHTVEILIYTALLTLVASRTIRTLILKANPELAHRFPVLRFAEVFSRHAHRILDAVFVFQGIDPSSFNLFTGTFIRQALDPNVNRNRLLDHCTDYKVRGMPDK